MTSKPLTIALGMAQEIMPSVSWLGVRQALASDTYFARIGGEEFAIVARGKNAEESQQLAERICQRVAEKSG